MIVELQNRLRAAGLSISRPAMVYANSTIRYEDLFINVSTVAAFLRSHGIGVGDRVAFFLPDCPLMIFIIMACAELGAVFCGMNIKASNDENSILMQKCHCKLLIHDDSLDRRAPEIDGIRMISKSELEKYYDADKRTDPPAVPCPARDSAFGLSFTSGTSGVSKAVMHSFADFILCAEACIARWGLGADDVIIPSIPLLTTLSLGSAVFPALLSGGSLAICGKRTPAETLSTINRYRCTFLVANPTICRRMVREKTGDGLSTPTLRGATIAGAPVNPELGAAFRREFGCQVFPHYGMTELLAISSTGIDAENNTVGRPFNHVRIRITDDFACECPPGEIGKILVKSRTMTSGYVLAETALPVDGDGWFDTGDRGCIDSDGNIRITGRTKEMIIRNGNNIYPQEIECRLLQLPGVIDCAVIGVPEPDFGEKIVAFVAAQNLDAGDVKRFLSPLMPMYKIPDEVVFVGELPRNANQKINKDSLRQWYATALKPSSETIGKGSYGEFS